MSGEIKTFGLLNINKNNKNILINHNRMN